MTNKITIILSVYFLLGNIGLAADSKGNRKDSTLFVGNTLVGLHMPSLISHPYSIGIYWGENILVGLESGSESPLYHHNFKVDDFTIEPHYTSSDQYDEGTTSNASLDNSGVYLRYFSGNSFNFILAFNQRNWSGEVTIKQKEFRDATNKYETLIAKADIKASAKIATLGIGNQWSTDSGFIIGVDWIVVSGFISKSSSVVVKSNTGLDGAEVENKLKDLGDVLNAISASPGLAVLTIGWSF